MDKCRLRLKYPSGAEFEAEGPAEFVLGEKSGFLEGLAAPADVPVRLGRTTAEKQKAGGASSAGDAAKPAFWAGIIGYKGELMTLRIKAPGISAMEAVLILMAADRALNSREESSAITISKALKTSGYEPGRLDRLLARGIREGAITASGTKRNRTYRLAPKGMEAAAAALAKLPSNL